MKLRRPDIGKFKHIARRNLLLMVASLIAIPGLFTLSYFMLPNSYRVTIRVELKSVLASLADTEEPKRFLLDSFSQARYFTQEELDYIKMGLNADPSMKRSIKVNGSNPFEITIADTKYSRIGSIAKKMASAFETRLGYMAYSEFLEEKQALEKEIESINESKKQEEENYLALDEEKTESERRRLLARLSETDSEISAKTQQLSIIESWIGSNKSRGAKVRPFKEKAAKLSAEIEQIKSERNELKEAALAIESESARIADVKGSILKLENRLDTLAKRLNSLNASESQSKTGYIKIPYLWQARLIEPSLSPEKILEGSNFRKRFIVGLMVGLLIVLVIFAYNLIFDPLITTIEELEEFSEHPVIGAIYELKGSKVR